MERLNEKHIPTGDAASVKNIDGKRKSVRLIMKNSSRVSMAAASSGTTNDMLPSNATISVSVEPVPSVERPMVYTAKEGEIKECPFSVSPWFEVEHEADATSMRFPENKNENVDKLDTTESEKSENKETYESVQQKEEDNSATQFSNKENSQEILLDEYGYPLASGVDTGIQETMAPNIDAGKQYEVPITSGSASHAKQPTSEQPSQSNVSSYAAKLKEGPAKKVVNFRKIENMEAREGVDVVLPRESVRIVQDKFANTLFEYFLGDRLAFPIVEYFVKTNWKKFGLLTVMINANGFFFFKFVDKKGMMGVFEGGPWMIRNMPIFLNIWSPTAKLKKDDIKEIAVWIKIHNVPIAAYTDDGLSMLASKLGSPKLLDSYTSDMCTELWGRSSYARAMIEISAETEYKDALTIAIPNLDGDDYTTENMRVEYEWKPPRCSHCCVFGHQYDLCPKQVRLPIHKNVDEDGFTQVKTKGKGAAVPGYKLNKPKTKLVYRPKQPASKPTGDNSFADKGKEVQGAALVKTGPSIVNNNPFNVLANMGEHGDTNTSTSGAQYATDSDDDEVIFDEAAHAFVDSVLSEGASTPGKTGLNG